MQYFRECVKGEWKTLILSPEEVEKVQRATAKRVIKVIKLVKEEAAAEAAKEGGAQLTPAEILVLVQKVAPTYMDVAHDLIRKRLTPPPAPKPADATAAAK